MNYRKSVILKKSRRYASGIWRPLLRGSGRHGIIANSVPKSGTHLLLQVIEVLPSIRDWGDFYASTPSFTMREIGADKMAWRVNGLAENELVSGHMFYDPVLDEVIAKKDAVHYFIYRDPRDVVVSEMKYLSQMNRWHRLHQVFKQMNTDEERLLFSIRGDESGKLSFYYPGIAERYGRFTPWLKSENCLPIRFEDLRSDSQESVVRKIIGYHRDKTGSDYDLDTQVKTSMESIDPQRSHTFRSGKSGGWSKAFSAKIKDIFKENAGDLLIELGYEHDGRW